MYCTRPATRCSPQAVRIVSRAPRRQASYYPTLPSASLISPFFGARNSTNDPFRGFERLIDDLTSTAFTPPQHFQLVRPQQQPSQQKPFSPRFDIRENADSYELRGEIPGVEAENLQVQFSDPQTLVIKGRTESQHQSGSNQQANEAQQTEATQSVKGKEPEHEIATTDATETSDTASVHSTASGSYKKPSVEEDNEGFENIESAEAVDTPTTTPGAETAQATVQPEATTQTQPETPQQPEQQQGYYFVSERSTGSFQRVFKFQHRIEQDGVTASLKNGILSIVVPKAGVPEVRKIQVQ